MECPVNLIIYSQPQRLQVETNYRKEIRALHRRKENRAVAMSAPRIKYVSYLCGEAPNKQTSKASKIINKANKKQANKINKTKLNYTKPTKQNKTNYNYINNARKTKRSKAKRSKQRKKKHEKETRSLQRGGTTKRNKFAKARPTT